MRLLPLAAVFAFSLAFAVPGLTLGSHTGPLTAACTNPEVGYTVNFPNNWYYNTHVAGEGAAEDVEACRYFSSEDFTVTPGSEPTGVSIAISSDHSAFDASADELVTVGGRQAARYESESTTPGFKGMYYVYSIDLGDGTTLAAQTSDRWVGDYEENKDILDAMMQSLVFGVQATPTPGPTTLPDAAASVGSSLSPRTLLLGSVLAAIAVMSAAVVLIVKRSELR